MTGIAFKVGFVDQKNRLRGMEKAIAYAIAGGLNDGGRKVFTVIRRQLRAQTQPRAYSVITSRTWAVSASVGGLKYVMRAKDEPIDIKEFRARLTAGGVQASPWGKDRVFARSFASAKRKSASNANGFLARKTSKRYPVRALHGPNLARELLGMTPGSIVPAVFIAAAQREVPPAIMARLARALG